MFFVLTTTNLHLSISAEPHSLPPDEIPAPSLHILYLSEVSSAA